MLDDQHQTQLSAYLERVSSRSNWWRRWTTAKPPDCASCCDHPVPAQRQDHPARRRHDARKPSFSLQRVGATNSLTFCRSAAGPRIHLAGAGPAGTAATRPRSSRM